MSALRTRHHCGERSPRRMAASVVTRPSDDPKKSATDLGGTAPESVNNVYEVRARILRERLKQAVATAEQKSDDEYCRLALLCLALLDRHKLDKKGRCRYCRRPGSGWWRAHQRCTVLPMVSFYLDQPREFLSSSDDA